MNEVVAFGPGDLSRRDNFPKLPLWLPVPLVVIAFVLLTCIISNKLRHEYTLHHSFTKPRHNMFANIFLSFGYFLFVWLLALSVTRVFYWTGADDIFNKASDGNDKVLLNRAIQHALDLVGVIALSFAKLAVKSSFFRFPTNKSEKVGLWIWVALSVAYDLSLIQLYCWSYLL
jgi:hypothetical protein